MSAAPNLAERYRCLDCRHVFWSTARPLTCLRCDSTVLVPAPPLISDRAMLWLALGLIAAAVLMAVLA